MISLQRDPSMKTPSISASQAAPEPGQAAPDRGIRRIMRFLTTTFLGGMLFLIPIVVAVVILRHAISLLSTLLRPLARLVPAETIAGFFVEDILAVAAILLMCFALGLIIGTRFGGWASGKLERGVFRKVPGYSLIKSATHSVAGMESSTDVHAALAWIEDAWVPAFVIEQHSRSGLFTVFVPSAPTPTGGSIYFLPQDRVRLLNMPVSKVVSCMMRLGADSGELLDAIADDPGVSSLGPMTPTSR